MSIGCLEREICVLTFKITFLACELHNVFRVAPVFLVFEVDSGDTRLVGMGTDTIVRYASSHPNSAFPPRTFANQVHNPNFIRVAYRKGLALAGITVFLDQRGDTIDGFAGSLAALESNINQTSVVNTDSVP